jgi:penicillin-insensitive murein endopeptidase
VGYEAIRISRNRYWGQPVTLRFIATLAAKMHAAGQAPLLIGDIGQPRGGPALTGHASHQNGLDADIWFERDPGRACRRPSASIRACGRWCTTT